MRVRWSEETVTQNRNSKKKKDADQETADAREGRSGLIQTSPGQLQLERKELIPLAGLSKTSKLRAPL